VIPCASHLSLHDANWREWSEDGVERGGGGEERVVLVHVCIQNDKLWSRLRRRLEEEEEEGHEE